MTREPGGEGGRREAVELGEIELLHLGERLEAGPEDRVGIDGARDGERRDLDVDDDVVEAVVREREEPGLDRGEGCLARGRVIDRLGLVS
jgi:hypothetical protein